MSKVIIYDRELEHPLVVNEDGSINVKGVELGGEGIEVDVGDIQVDVPQVNLVMKKFYQEEDSKEVDLGGEHHFLAIANDSKEHSITVKVHDMSIKVLPWESFEAEFEPFDSFSLVNNDKAPVRIGVFEKKVEGEE